MYLPVAASLHWLPVSFRCDCKVLLMSCEALNGQTPVDLSDLPSRPLRSNYHLVLVVPRCRWSTVVIALYGILQTISRYFFPTGFELHSLNNAVANLWILFMTG